MESPVAQSSNDGIYGLVDHPSGSAPEPTATPTVPTAASAPAPAPTATLTGPTAAPVPTGLFGRPAPGPRPRDGPAAPGGNGKPGTTGGVRLRRKASKTHNLRTERPPGSSRCWSTG